MNEDFNERTSTSRSGFEGRREIIFEKSPKIAIFITPNLTKKAAVDTIGKVIFPLSGDIKIHLGRYLSI